MKISQGKTAIVIPARYASTRLPGKLLLKESGKYLIQHVYEQACQAKCADRVILAIDDPKLGQAIDEFGGQWVMTNRDHFSGTDRIAEVSSKIDADIILNIQGDEPLIDPIQIEELNQLLVANPEASMATLAVPIQDEKTYLNPNAVKVVFDNQNNALYFSRSPIPFVRDGKPDFQVKRAWAYLHIGVYAYRKQSLEKFTQLPISPIEKIEKLEQLRALFAGWQIKVGITNTHGIGVDTWDDYQRFLQIYRANKEKIAA